MTNARPTTGYIDLQVNGYAGVDFNRDDLAEADLRRACEALRADGVDRILATIITEHLDVMCHRLARLVALREADALARELVAGIHIEGPFISPLDGYRGAHPADAVTPADPDAMRRLLDAAAGLTRIVTLAPECDADAAVTRMLADAGVIVSAGHTDADGDRLDAAIDAGLSMVTHLGNGCPLTLPRHDNIVQRVLARADRLHIGLIADGVHVPTEALGNVLRCVGLDRCFVVSDASAPAGLGPGRYTLGRLTLDVGDDYTARMPDSGQLAGSAMPLRLAERVLIDRVGLSAEQADRLTRAAPAKLLAGDALTIQ